MVDQRLRVRICDRVGERLLDHFEQVKSKSFVEWAKPAALLIRILESNSVTTSAQGVPDGVSYVASARGA